MDMVVAFQAHALAWLLVIAAVVCFGLALCWALNGKWRARRLAELRARYAEMQPSDPGYNQVRVLYTDMAIRLHSEKGLQAHADGVQATPDGSVNDGSLSVSASD